MTGRGLWKGRMLPWIQLRETIFHPQGGGQPSDLGTINGHRVVAVVKRSLAVSPYFGIDHFFDDPISFSEGQSVQMAIDPLFRQQSMRLHSAGHLIANVAERLFPTLHPLQGHHFPNEARVTFKVLQGTVEKDLLSSIQSAIYPLIASRAPIHLGWDAMEKRTVQIQGFAPIPCGGTHVSHLGEIGKVILQRAKQKKQELYIHYAISDSGS